MQLRFVEDRRTLCWAFVLFPLAPVLAYARPSLVPWLAPLVLYTSYCAGVLSHNHNHSSVFVGRRANLTYGAWLSLFYGFPIFAWIPTHNQNHHRYLNGEGDLTQTGRHSPKNTLAAALTYPLVSGRSQLPAVWRYARDAFARHPARARRIVLECSVLVFGHAALLALAVSLHGLRLGVIVYAGSLGLPALLAAYWMMLTNYLQHVDCDPASADDHSRNFVRPLWNWFVFDNGLHTVHHENPGVHWSRYRELHHRREPAIDPKLNQSSLFAYMATEYLAPSRRPSA